MRVFLILLSDRFIHLASFLPTPLFLDFFTKPYEAIKDMVNQAFNELASYFFSLAYTYILDVTLIETDLSRIPLFHSIFSFFQSVALGFAILMLVVRVMRFFNNSLLDGDDSIVAVLRDCVVSLLWISFFDDFVLKFLLPINNFLVSALKKLPIIFDNNSVINAFNTKIVAIEMVIMILILAVCLIVLAIQSAIRYVDILITILLSPIVAAGSMNKTEIMTKYTLDTIAIVFMQPLTILIIYFILTLAADLTLIGMVLAIGATVVAMRGPQTIKNFIYTTGAGGAVSGVGKMALMRAVMKK